MGRERSQDSSAKAPQVNTSMGEGHSTEVDPEDSRDDFARDDWLRENVPPHHR